jgi:phosphoglycolate phosphatase
MRPVENVLFDLDGTLVDSSGAIRASLAHALKRVGGHFPDDLPVAGMIGLPLLDILRQHFGIVGEPAEQAITHYRSHYDRHAREATTVYEEIDALLESLHGGSRRLFVATVKPEPIARKVLDEMALAHWFQGVAGSSMDHRLRDKAGIIRALMREHGLAAERSAMVGDRAQDVAGARANGLLAIGVTWGFGSTGELAAAQPDHIVQRPAEIMPLIAAGPASPS